MNVKNVSEKLVIAARQNKREREYWIKQLSGHLEKTGFPPVFKNTGLKEYQVNSLAFELPGELASKLMQTAKASDRALNLLLITGLTLLLNKYTGGKDIMIGTPIYKQKTGGDFINTVLVLRNPVQNNITFKEFISRVKQTILEAVKHQNYPMELLVKELDIDNVNGGFPLFDTAILLENIHEKKYLRHIRCNMIFSFRREAGHIGGVVEYNSSLVEKFFAERIIAHFKQLLYHALFNPHLQLPDIEIFTGEEKKQLLYDFNNTPSPYPKEKTIHGWFEEQADKTPGNIALSSPVDLGDIYDQLRSEKINPHPVEKIETCCFKKNPYICQSRLELPGNGGYLNILKTHRHNSVVGNNNVVKLLRLFNGERNLKSIFSRLRENRAVEFSIYTMGQTDLLEVTFQFNRKAEVYSNHELGDFVKLVQCFYRNHLIELKGVKVKQKVKESENEKEADFEDSGSNWVEEGVLIKNRKISSSRVLLLGDTPGMPTTGLLYLASYLKRNGISACCQFYDAGRDYGSMRINIEELLEKIQPRVVAISLKWFIYMARVLDICKIVKEYAAKHSLDIHVVVGGNTASYYWKEFIKYDCIDYLIRGDGEGPLLKICRGEDKAAIPNCIYKENGKIVENPITYIHNETNSAGIYLSHLDEILLSHHASLFGTFFIYTHKGCAMNCLYCGGCSRVQQETFNRKKVFKRGPAEVRKDIIEVKKYTSTFQFEFDIPDTAENLLRYCEKTWEGIDLSGHFCIFSSLTSPSPALIRLVSRTFKYVYWDFDICTPSERHRKQLVSLGLVKPQPSDDEILDFMARCEKYRNIEVRPNLINGLPYFTPGDIGPGEKLLSKVMTGYSCLGELHWARLHAQPGAPIVQDAEKHHMHSYASTFNDFLKCSEENFSRDSTYSTVENFSYPYIYFKDDRLNSRVTNFYLETNKKMAQYKNNKRRSSIITNRLTYRQLNERADQLAGMLRARGVSPGTIVGLRMGPSADIPPAILAILKTGAAYMPIDPEFPAGRSEYMLRDSGACVLLEESEILVSKSEKEKKGTGKKQSSRGAYVIYTSGTTGKPKGVILTHENLVNYVHWFSRAANLTANDKTLLTSSFAFDLGYTSLYTSLLKGGELHILPREIYLLAERLLDYIKEKGITYIKMTPSLFSTIINNPGFSGETCKSLRLAAVGGEPINVEDIEKAHSLCRHLQIMNHYGPTEATIGCISALIDFDRFDAYKKHPVIGKPIDNTNVYILGKDLNLLPPGVPGELCISGVCLAGGYLNRPELTMEKFCLRRPGGSFEKPPPGPPQNFLPGKKGNQKFFGGSRGAIFQKSPPGRRRQRTYRTGDLARWMPDGNIEFLGRTDNQVKIRGYRIELEEIENRLKKHEHIKDAAVVVNEQNLCAYIVPGAGTIKTGEKISGDKKILRLTDIDEKEINIAVGFEAQVDKNPGEIAVKSNGSSLTFHALDQYANRVAHRIFKEYDDRYKLSKNERTRYKRQMQLYGWGIESQEKLKSAAAFVAGAGGGASPTIMQLALLGVGTIKVCDFDEVELSNLNRQFLHDEERLGMNKALSAKITVNKINPHVKIIPYTQKLTRENVFELVGDSDIIFDMLDGPAEKFILSEYAVVRQIPHVIIAMTDLNAYSAIFHTPHTPCYHCIFDKKKLETIVSGMQNYTGNYSRNPLAVASPSLFTSTGTAVSEALKILLGFDRPAYNKFFYFNPRGAAENLRYTPGYVSMTHLFSGHFRKISKEQGFDWDMGWRGNFLEELHVESDPGCPLCSGKGKETQKNLQGKIIIEKEKVPDGNLTPQTQTVALLLRDGVDMAAGIVGTLKAGKTSVPLNPNASIKQLSEILEDSEARIILTAHEGLETARKLRDKVNKNIRIIDMKQVHEMMAEDENPGIYTPPAQIVCMSFPGNKISIKKFLRALVQGNGPYPFETHKPEISRDTLSAQLREYLKYQLPGYMIPTHFVQLDKIPLTANGKVDRSALPAPRLTSESRKAPVNRVEKKLVEIWADVLEIEKERIGTDSNFFRLGGHSLNATVMAFKIHKELNVKFPLTELFKRPTILELAEILKSREEDKYISLEPVEKKEYYSLTSAQKRLYILQQMKLENKSYNMPYITPMEIEMDLKKLEETFGRLIARHESLRTSFRLKKEEPVQVIRQPREIELKPGYYEAESPGQVEGVMDDFIKTFDLSRAPLLRVAVLKTGKDKFIFMLDMHHIITDGTSQLILTGEFMSLYRGEELPAIKLQYKDYAQWQTGREQQEIIKRQETYWLDSFPDEVPVLNLPVDYPRPENRSFEGSSEIFLFNREETKMLPGLSTGVEATLYMVILAVFNILLSKLSGQEDIVIGTPIVARRHPDLEQIVGMFANTLPMRNYPMGEKTFNQFLTEVKEHTSGAFENQEYPFENLVDKLAVKRDTSRNPVFDVMFNLLNLAGFPREIPGINEEEERDVIYKNKTSKFDLNLTAAETGETIVFNLEYCTRLFNAHTIQRIIGYFKRIVHVLSRDKTQKIANIEIIDQQDRDRLLNELNGAAMDFPGNKTVQRLFREEAARAPGNRALIFNDSQLTYEELNKQAGQLAGLLRKKGTQPGDIIALMMERSLEMIIGLLGIMKTGAAYLPIDPGYPQERIDYMLKDSNVGIIVTRQELSGETIGIVNCQRESDVGNRLACSADLAARTAYIIYTSGSTGKPKGVVLTHGNLVNYVTWFSTEAHLTEKDSTPLTSSFGFDLGYTSLYPSLLRGGQLHILPKETYMLPGSLLDYIRTRGMTYLKMTPSLFGTIVIDSHFSVEACRTLRLVVLGGEAIRVSDVEKAYRLCPHMQIMNHYGPTEVTIGCIAQYVDADPAALGMYKTRPTIGRPIFNTRVFILDKYLNLLPVGVAGELCMSGASVARGYLNNPELIMEKFVRPVISSSKHSPNDRLYKTGDLARCVPDGNIEFLGRIDNQVKVRGFRIELGEIENQLVTYPGIKETVVIYKDDQYGDKYLCAYITGKQAAPTDLRDFLAVRVPGYMIPSYFVSLEKIPLTPNGKIDRNVLPEPEIKAEAGGVAPRDKKEEKLAAIWADVLNINTGIGIDDDFFRLGGHSLKATLMAARVHRAFDTRLPLSEVFRNTTIRKLAAYIKEAVNQTHVALEPVEKREYYDLSHAQKRLWMLNQVEMELTAYNLCAAYEFEDLNIRAFQAAVQTMVKRHESLRTTFITVKDQPKQKINPYESPGFTVEYLDFRKEEQSEGKTRQIIRKEAQTVFHLEKGPLVRVKLLHLQEQNYLCIFGMHHIISDGWSMGVAVNEILTLYNADCNGSENTAPPLKIQYKDFSQWQNQQLKEKNLNRHREYWLNQFKGQIPILELKTDFPRPAIRTFKGDSIAFAVDKEIIQGLKEIGAKQGASLFMTLLAAVKVLLYCYTGQTDIIIGTPTAGREHSDLENQIGFYLNVLPLRTGFTASESFESVLTKVKQTTLEAYNHQVYPFDLLLEALNLKRDRSRSPLFDVLVHWFNPDIGLKKAEKMQRVSIKQREVHLMDSKFDLTVNFIEQKHRVDVQFKFNTDLFKRETIMRMTERLKTSMKRIISKPFMPISEFSFEKELQVPLIRPISRRKKQGRPESFR